MDNAKGVVENYAPPLDLSHVVHIHPQDSSEQRRLPEEQQTTGESSEHFQGNKSSGSQRFTGTKCQMNFNINPNNQDMIHISIPANIFSQMCDKFFLVHQTQNSSQLPQQNTSSMCQSCFNLRPGMNFNTEIIDPDIIIISDDESMPDDAEIERVLENTPRSPEQVELQRIYLQEQKKQQEDLNENRNISNENQDNSNENQENSNQNQENSIENQENSNQNQENSIENQENSFEFLDDILRTSENPQLMDNDDIEEELYQTERDLISLNDPK